MRQNVLDYINEVLSEGGVGSGRFPVSSSSSERANILTARKSSVKEKVDVTPVSESNQELLDRITSLLQERGMMKMMGREDKKRKKKRRRGEPKPGMPKDRRMSN